MPQGLPDQIQGNLQLGLKHPPWADARLWLGVRHPLRPTLGEMQPPRHRRCNPSIADHDFHTDLTIGLLAHRSTILRRHAHRVLPQYCGAVGKKAKSQVSVEVIVSNGGVKIRWRGGLYLPQSWAEDGTRPSQSRVSPEVVFQTKLEIALDLIRQTLGHGVARAPVLADSAVVATARTFVRAACPAL